MLIPTHKHEIKMKYNLFKKKNAEFSVKKSGEVVTAQLKPNSKVSGGMADIKGPRQDGRSVRKAKALKLKWE